MFTTTTAFSFFLFHFYGLSSLFFPFSLSLSISFLFVLCSILYHNNNHWRYRPPSGSEINKSHSKTWTKALQVVEYSTPTQVTVQSWPNIYLFLCFKDTSASIPLLSFLSGEREKSLSSVITGRTSLMAYYISLVFVSLFNLSPSFHFPILISFESVIPAVPLF